MDRNMKYRVALIALSALAIGACGSGDGKTGKAKDKADMSVHTGQATTDLSPGDAAFAASEAAMHSDMAEASGETIDEAYIAKMMAHHRGAVAMADVALARSRDPAILRMAQTVKDTQTVEMAEMQAWEPSPEPVVVPAATVAETPSTAPPAAAAPAAKTAATPAEK